MTYLIEEEHKQNRVVLCLLYLLQEEKYCHQKHSKNFGKVTGNRDVPVICNYTCITFP